MEQFVKLINKLFAAQSDVVLFGLCGVVLSFVAVFVLGCFCGDFARAKRGLKQISLGRLSEGQEKLKKGAIGFHSEKHGFNFESVVAQPFAYSLTKRMAAVMLVLTAFFSCLSLVASLALSGVFTGDNTVVFLSVFGSGLALCSVLLALTSGLLRAATGCFYKAQEILSPQEDSAAEAINKHGQDYADDIPAEVLSLCTRIEEVALTGGANHSTLSRLYSEIKDLQQRGFSSAAEAKLDAALEVLSVLIDSAL